MGIPKLFRYITRRYPCVTERLKDYQIPTFDNLYLDANGIIHGCSHPNDSDLSFRISEEDILRNIFRYLELLFQMIQPQKIFFISIDGVAPRAKINQQRGRRFRSAKDVQIQEAKLKSQGVELPKEKRFDSNCITPGTLFMAKLDEQLKYYITYKISTDKLWQKCKVIFSGSQVPGEGEYKIMEYIRYLKAQPDYDINTKHCLYGLDADLIMLGLSTHEMHFSLLREEIIFGKKQKNVCITPEETKFCLFHLSLLREYIDHELSSLKEKLPFPYDLDKIIDDWILMGFLIGNDFVPHLPNLHISRGAVSILYQVYMDVLPTLGGYINEAGTLKLDRFEVFIERLARLDTLLFSEDYADLKFLESKTGKPFTETNAPDKCDQEKSESSEETTPPKRMPDREFDALLRSAAGMSLEEYDDEDGDDESDNEIYTMEDFVQRKKNYYVDKLKYENIDDNFLKSQAECYVRALQWNLHYYYNGCCSWSWYYPHHYAPYISDIKGFKDVKFEFELGEPFMPFEQLLAVLPSYSKDLLPLAFQHLVMDENSPIIEYYPVDFETDLNGKQHEWESVVLIPFINIKDLQNAMAPHYEKLTAEERARNKHGPMHVYSYTNVKLGVCKAPEYFPDINNYAKVQLVNQEDIIVPKEKLVKGRCHGVKLDVYYPGFSTFQYIDHTANLEKSEGKVFPTLAYADTMIIHITPLPETSISTIGSKLLGKIVYVNWPHLKEALVTGVSNSATKIIINSQMKHVTLTGDEELWALQTKHIAEIYKSSMGIDIGETKYLVHARLLLGKNYVYDGQGNVHREKQWSETEDSYAYQTTVKDITVHSGCMESNLSVNDIFALDTVCFMLGHPYYGSVGKVLEAVLCGKPGKIKVSLVVTQEPSFKSIKQVQIHYMSGNSAAQRLGISRLLLSRITGTLYVKQLSNLSQPDDVTQNIGLNLKSTWKNEEAPGYTRKSTSGHWCYSSKTVDLVRSYMLKCPELFERLAQNLTNSSYQEENLFNKGSDELNDTVTWLKEQLKGIESRVCGLETIDSEMVKRIEEKVDAYLKVSSRLRTVVEMYVQPHFLYIPNSLQRNVLPDPKMYTELLDRVCCIKEHFTVPLGYKGTVIGIQKSDSASDVMYDVLFDKPFAGGLTINGSSELRCYRLSPFDFINISHGNRVERARESTNVNMPTMDSWTNPMYDQEVQLRPNASAFASYKNKNHVMMEAPKPRIIQKNVKGISQNNQMNQKFKYNAQNPSMVPREPYKSVKAVQVNAQKVPLAVESTSEFQAIWNELHKKQVPNKIVQAGSMSSKVKHINKRFLENSPQDPSAFLKAVLKIPDGVSGEVIQPGISKVVKHANNNLHNEDKSLDTPPLVQQLFDHARKNEKIKDEKLPTRYCSQLLNYYQLSGIGMPRYNYIADNETNLIQAHILLPDKRIFVGDSCINHEQAAESAAKKVYTELKLANVLPNMKTLLPPPQHWYSNPQNGNWSQNIRLSAVPHQTLESTLVQLFPERLQKEHPSSGHQQMSKKSEKSRSHSVPNPAHNETKLETTNCPAFVPLQAQKKSRHITSKQADRKDNSNQNVKYHSASVVQPKKKELPAKAIKVEVVSANEKKQKPVQSSTNQTQNISQTNILATKPKKSRVAAKFGIPSQTEENNHSNSST